jgi:uncharacterized protein
MSEEQIKFDALALVDNVNALVVRTQADLTVAADYLVAIKTLRKRVEAEFDPGIQEAFQHHRTLVAQKRKWTEPLDKAEATVKPKVTAFLEEQDRIRLAAEREAWIQKKALERTAEAASDKATELINNGDLDEAAKVMEDANVKVQATPLVVVPPKPVAPAVTMRETWDYEVVDLGAVPREYLVLNDKLVGALVSKLHDQFNVAGIRVFSTKGVSVRTGK